MLKIKTELVTIINDKKEKSQSWQAHLSHDDGFYNGCGQCELIGYGDCEEAARDNLNVAFNKLFMEITDLPTLQKPSWHNDSHGESNWGPDVGLEIIED